MASTTNPNLNPNPTPNPNPNQVGFDDNAAFRHAPIFDKRDLSQVRACVRALVSECVRACVRD